MEIVYLYIHVSVYVCMYIHKDIRHFLLLGNTTYEDHNNKSISSMSFSPSSCKVILRKAMYFLFCFLTEMKSLLYVVSKYFMSFK